MLNLKRIAFYKIKRTAIPFDELTDFIRDWWSKKYTLPNNHPLLLDKTLEELLIEYYEDYYINNEDELTTLAKELGENSPIANIDLDATEEWFKRVMKNQYSPNLHGNEDAKDNVVDFDDKY